MYYTNDSGKAWQTNDLTHATQEPHARSFSSTGFSRMDRIFADSSDEATYDIRSVCSDSSDAESIDCTSSKFTLKRKRKMSQRQTPRNGMYYTNYSGKVWQTNDLTHATQEPHARSFSSTGFSRMDRIFADSSDEATYDIRSVFF
uniref:Uncharacterized protein n=1 Tax=Ditylum brightwellii TaxID=49249 RepID=A0A7S4VZ46_9STRA